MYDLGPTHTYVWRGRFPNHASSSPAPNLPHSSSIMSNSGVPGGEDGPCVSNEARGAWRPADEDSDAPDSEAP